MKTVRRISAKQMKEMLKRNPGEYRVGVTKNIPQRNSDYNSDKVYGRNKGMVYRELRKNASLRNAEQELLNMLPRSHPYNPQTTSNIPPGKKGGFPYLLKMKGTSKQTRRPRRV